MKPIKVVDSIMGSGKTSWAIQHMNANKGPFLYVTPYLTEINRILKACDGFIQPTDEKGTKTDDLKRLLGDEQNIATTHELFRRLDDEARTLIRAGRYTLIMDEVVNVITPLDYPKDEVLDMIDSGILRKEAETSKGIAAVSPGDRQNLRKYDDLRTWAAEQRLVLVDDELLFWIFPAGIFRDFKEVYNLCYLFEGQSQKAYYDLHGIQYEMLSACEAPNGRYELVPYLPAEQEEPTKARLRSLIEVVYDDRLNCIGEADNALSVNWFKAQKHAVKKLVNSMHNFFNNVTRSTADQRLWTCPKARMEVMSGGRYARSFIAANTRATNDYRERSVIAYCKNVYMKPEVNRFFEDRGVTLDKELYALSEMVQLIWRSRIREWKPIVLYIPSKRMRNLFDGWLNGALLESEENAA